MALICPALLTAQTSPTSTFTTINLNNTVLQSPVKRLGINLGAANFYDSGQILKNLIVSNPGFEGQIAQTMVLCSAGTATSCTDSISYSGWPADYWDGATYTVVYGTAIGRTGTITTSTSGSGQDAVFNFDSSGVAPSNGDYMIVKKPKSVNFCAGSSPSSCIPSAAEGWSYTLGGNGTVGTNTTDLAPDTVGTQSLVMTAPAAGDSATITYYFDSYANHTFLQLNGTYNLSFKAKTTNPSGSGSLYVSLQRLSSNVPNGYIYNAAFPLTNQWQTYTIPFTANETGNAVGSVRLIFGTSAAGQALSANQVYLDDTSLVKQNTDPTNTTVFRDEVVNTLKQLNPGVVRFWFNQETETLDNLLATQFARQRSQYQYVEINYISYGLTEFLQLLQTVSSGANATSTPPEPWIVIPITLSNTEASNLIDYLAGDGTTVYGAKRIAAGQTTPWTQVFPKIHLELSNEAWNNSLYGGNMANGQAYGTRAQSVFASMRSNQNYNAASFDLIINGQGTQTGEETLIQSYCNNNDTFASQPYMMLQAQDPFGGAAGNLQTSPAAIETLFGSTFAEAEAFVTPSGTAENVGNGFVLQNIGVAQSSGRPVQYAITETNVDPFEGSLTLAEANSYTSSLGAGMALIDSMLQNMRVGVLTQNIFSLTGYQYFPYNEPPLFLYGTVVDMGVTNLQRPQFQAEETANNAIGANTNMLQTVHTGLDPTWNQAYSSTVQLNNAHYLQSFAYNSGDNYSLIIINTNRSASEQVNFAGANVPGGTVQMTQLTSANITDTNETAATFAPVTSTLSNFSAAAGMTLPPFSMTTLTWSAPGISNVTVTPSGTSATITWSIDDPTATSVVNYGTTTAYGSQSTSVAPGSTQSVTLTGLTAGTEYNFSIVSTSGSGAISSSANYTFGTTASFTLSAPSSISVTPGTSGTVPVQVSDTNGYTGSVTLSVSGLPTGVTGTFQTSSGSASLLLTVPSTALGGTYSLTITGTAGGTSQIALVNLVISGASQSQTITFNTIPNQYIGATVTAVATSSAGLTPVTFSVVPNGNCSSSGTNGATIKFLAAGNCGIIASQAGNGTYGPASQGQIVVINSALPPQTITFTSSNADETVGSTLALTATASSGLPVSFASATTGTCTVSGTTATFIAIGTCTINASQAGNSQYAAAPTVPLTINVKGQTQTITFPTIATQTAGTSITLSATSTSKLAVSFASSTQSVCSVSGTTLTLNTAGSCTITASQAGNNQYAAATPVPQTFTVNAAPVASTITFGPIAAQNDGTPLTLTATSTNTVTPITFAASPSSVCSVSGSTATFTGTGTCSITASQVAGNGYLAATPVTQSFTVSAALKSQSISFTQPAAQYVGTPLTLSATATSGLTVSFVSNSTSICTVSGTTAQFIAGGTCSITASQAGGSGYAAATPVTQTFTVNATGYPQTITFNTIATQTVGTPLTLSATSVNASGTATGLTVSFASTTPSVCSVSGTTATFVAAGTCSITASQPGNSQYAAATPVTQSFTVNAGPQTITFGTIPAQTVGATLTLTASASSNLPVSYAASPSSVCSVTGSTATFAAAGTCTIVASQGGNGSYAAATPVTQNVAVLQAQTITFGAIAAQTAGTSLTLTATVTSNLPITYTTTSAASVCTLSSGTVTFVGAGTCSITAAQAGNSTYAAATPVTQAITVTAPQTQTISFGAIAAQQVGTPLTLSASATSKLPVSYVSNSTAVCTVSGTTATFLTSGTCSITASQAGGSGYSAATPVTQTFSVNGEGQVITFNPISAQQAGTTLALTATSSSTLAVSYASTTTSVCSVSGSTATLAAAGTCSITASQAGNSMYAAATPVTQSFTVQSGTSAPATTTVSLGSAATLYGIFNNGSAVTNGGLDTSDYAYSANLLGTGLTFQGIPYVFGTAGSANAATSTTITLPAGSYSTLNFLGTAIYGNQTSQTFTVTYTDGTTSTFTQSMSDWGSPQNYTGETVASAMAYRVTPSGAQSTGQTFNLYAYSFALNSAKTVKSFTLPNLRNVTVLAVTLSGASTQAAQTITFGPIPSQIVGGTLTVSATASSGLPVTFSVVPNGNCSVSGNVVTFLNVGNCGVLANQAGNSAYAAAPQVGQIVVVNNPTAQTITFGTIATQTVGTPLTLNATASSGLAVSYTSSTTGICTVSGSTATFLAAGTCTITASQAGNNVYSAATSVSQSFTVNAGSLKTQTITFGTIASQTVGTPLTLSATASSGLAVTFASTTASVCSVSGTTATFAAAGTCTITASQAGNSTYAATSVSQSFTVNGQSQTITFGTIAAQTVGTPLTLGATASSGLAVSYASSTTGICTVSGSTASFVAAGTCTIAASQAGNSTYAAATPVSQSFTVNAAALQSQTITFGSIAAQTVGTPLTLGATASSGLAVSYASSTTGICTVSGSTASFVAAGTCTITASQAGNSTYAAATSVSQSFTVNAATLVSVTVPAATLAQGNYNAFTASIAGASSAPSNLGLGGVSCVNVAGCLVNLGGSSGSLNFEFFYVTSNSATLGVYVSTSVLPGTYTIPITIGTTQAGTFTLTVPQLTQTITFGTIAAQTVGTPLTLGATASSGLAVSYVSSTTGICTVSGSTATFVTAGTCTITASQAGNSTYAAATSVSQSFTVNAAALKSQTITFNPIAAQTVGKSLTVSATASSGLPVSFVIVQNGNCSISGNVVTFLNQGNCGVIATQAGNSTYAAAPAVGQVIVVN